MLIRAMIAAATFWVGVITAIIIFAITVNWRFAVIAFAVGLILSILQGVMIERKVNSEFDNF